MSSLIKQTMNEYDFDSDMSEIDDADQITGWLDEEDIEEEKGINVSSISIPDQQTKNIIDVVHKSKYIVENVDLFYALCEIDDWGFVNFPEEQQEDYMKSLVIKSYKPGENIIIEGEIGTDLFIVVATEDTAEEDEVEVVSGNLVQGTEVFLTKQKRGTFFGQKCFLTRRLNNKRGATVRIPKDMKNNVNIAVLTSEYFDKWDSFRYLLLIKTVPMIQTLPRKERQRIVQNLVIKEFKDGEYIIRQGDTGEDFYIIQDGSVQVTEKRPHVEYGWNQPYEHVLVTLREGHFFGEMALVTNEPRVASVISVRTTVCLCLSKKVFREALSDETFNQVLNNSLAQRQNIRANREERVNSDDISSENASSETPISVRKTLVRRRTTGAMHANNNTSLSSIASQLYINKEVNISTTLLMHKLESGTRVINKYLIEKEIGKGTSGEVYLCTNQDTNIKYAMKIINRPHTSTWSDECIVNSIKQEIAVMKKLKHENIVNLHEVIDDPNTRKIFLIQEYLEGGALMEDKEQCKALDPILARKYFRDILRGLCYLHSEGIIHRDIKPQNMLLSKSGVVKIADFGAAAFTGTSSEKVSYGGTPAFMAPELFLINSSDIDYTKSSSIDIFALGATLYFMICGKPPWMGKNQIELATKIQNMEITFPSAIIDPHLKHLLRKMLAKDYRTRLTLDAVVVDEWVTSEGSDPLFEHHDCHSIHYQEYLNYFNHMGIDVDIDNNSNCIPKILIIDPSSFQRLMFSRKLSSVTSVMCCCLANDEDGIHMISSAIQQPQQLSNHKTNFEYIFLDISLHNQFKSIETINKIRSLGYQGRIIAIAHIEHILIEKDKLDLKIHLEKLINDSLVDAFFYFPISTRDISRIIITGDIFTEFKKISPTGVTEEDIELAINSIAHSKDDGAIGTSTTSNKYLEYEQQQKLKLQQESTDNSKLILDITTSSSDDLDIKDFQDFNHSMISMHSMYSISDKQQGISRDSSYSNFDVHKLQTYRSVKGHKRLQRKRNFTVVPYNNNNNNNNDNNTFSSSSKSSTPSNSITKNNLSIYSNNSSNTSNINVTIDTNYMYSPFYNKNNKLNTSSLSMIDSGNDLNIITHSTSLSSPTKDETRKLKREMAMNKSKLAHENRLQKVNSENHEISNNNIPLIATMINTARSVDKANKQLLNIRDRLKNKHNENIALPNDNNDDIVSTESIQYFHSNESMNFQCNDDDDSSSSTSSDDDLLDCSEEIQELNGDALDDMFNDLIQNAENNKNSETNRDLQDWNHIIANKNLKIPLISSLENTNLELKIRAGHYESQGVCSYMEDRIYSKASQLHIPQQIQSLSESSPYNNATAAPLAIFAVFDGHNGYSVAETLQTSFPENFEKLFRSMESKPEYKDSSYEHIIGNIFDQTIAEIDMKILRDDYQQQKSGKMPLQNDCKNHKGFAGACGVMMAVAPAKIRNSKSNQPIGRNSFSPSRNHNIQVFIAHVGDCRALLCSDGLAINLTEDHKPNLKSERLRIEAAGGWVQNGRVNANLGVSRSIGDIQYKMFNEIPGIYNGSEDVIGSLWNSSQQVISKPDYKHFVIEEPFEFVVLASDGLWDVFEPQECVNFIRKYLFSTRNIEKTANELINKALKRGSQDNISVVIVVFHQEEEEEEYI